MVKKCDSSFQFFIHGGALKAGSGNADVSPEFLLDHGVVLVAINYRLGPFGFLSSAEAGLTGNQGFRDQRQALIWVRDNIEFFGGDPDKASN